MSTFRSIATGSIPTEVDLTELIPLNRVPSLLPRLRKNKHVNLATVYRWTNEGCRGIRLAYVQVGSTRCTCQAWLTDFLRGLNRTNAVQDAVLKTEHEPVSHRRDDAETDRRLDRFFKGSGKASRAGNRKAKAPRTAT